LRDAALSYQQPLHNLRMVTPRAESSPSNCATPGEVSRSPGTTTAHSRFSRNSFGLICHCPKEGDFDSPIWTMDQCRTNASAAASSGNGPDSMKWLFPCTKIPTIGSRIPVSTNCLSISRSSCLASDLIALRIFSSERSDGKPHIWLSRHSLFVPNLATPPEIVCARLA